MPDKVYSILAPPSAAEAGAEYVLEFDDEAHGDTSSFAPDEEIYMLFQSRRGVFFQGVASDGVYLTDKGTVTRKRVQSGLELNNDTREITLTYIPSGTPEVVFFGTEIELDQSKLKGGIVSPVDYDGSYPVLINVIYDTEFQSLKHSPRIRDLIPEDDGGVPYADYEGAGDLASFPLAYQVEYGY